MAREEDIHRLVLYQRIKMTVCADGYIVLEGANSAWKELLVTVTNADEPPSLGSIDWFGEL